MELSDVYAVGSILIVRERLKLDSKEFCRPTGYPVYLIGFVSLFFLTICAGSFAQEPRCTLEISAIVALPDATLVQGLGSEGFVAREKSGSSKIAAVISDRAPRHILFVVETGRRVPPTVRKVEGEILTEILKRARPEDSFALLTAYGPRREVRFGANNVTLASAIDEIAIGSSGKNEGTGVLDAIFEGINWFQPRSTGDTVLVLTLGIESKHQISFAKVRDGLAKEGIHVFGFQLGPFFGGSYNAYLSTGPFGRLSLTGWFDPNRENLFTLSRYTGGFVALENAEGDPQKEYQLTDQRLQAIRHAAQQEYKAIVEFYKIQIEGSPKDLEIDLAASVRRELPKAEVIYPRGSQNCLEAPAPH